MPPISGFKPFSLLITGAPGHLADAVLAQLGHTLPALTRVRCMVEDTRSEAAVLEWRRAHPGTTEIFYGNLAAPESLAAACVDLRGGVVLHCAAIFHPEKISDWSAINRDGTLVLAKAARMAGVKRFVYISSIQAHGEMRRPPSGPPMTRPFIEDLPAAPYSAYGISKAEAEDGLRQMHDPGAFEIVIIRPGQFYGPPVPPHQVSFLRDVQQRRVVIAGNGDQPRCVSFIDDLALGVIACLYHPAAAGETFNLCDAECPTQAEIVAAAAEALALAPRSISRPVLMSRLAEQMDRAFIRFNRYHPKLHLFGEQYRHLYASSIKAQILLGHAPQMTLREGMAQAVKWAQDNNLID